MRVGRQVAAQAVVSSCEKIVRLAALDEAEILERERHQYRGRVVNLRHIDIGLGDPRSAEQLGRHLWRRWSVKRVGIEKHRRRARADMLTRREDLDCGVRGAGGPRG